MTRIEIIMKSAWIGVMSLSFVAAIGCTPADRHDPEQLRKDTAKATEAAARDAKAIAQGVADGLKAKTTSPVNINTATADRLKALPGVDDARARHIIANRPYDHTGDLVRKHVMTRDDYDRISGQIVTQ